MQGFNRAADDLVINLKDELDRFKEKVKETPQTYHIAHKSGYIGGGSLGSIYAVILLLLGGLGLWSGRKK